MNESDAVAFARRILAAQAESAEPAAWCVPNKKSGRPEWGRGWIFSPIKQHKATMPLFLRPQPQSADVAELVKALEKIEAWLRRFTKGRAMIHGAEEHADIARAALAKHGGK